MTVEERLSFYPDAKEIDLWMDKIWEASEKVNYTVEHDTTQFLPDRFGMTYLSPATLKFTIEGMDPFYCSWFAPIGGPRPLIAFVPGYGGEMVWTPSASTLNYAVLSICPMGYWTPKGIPTEKLEENSDWPVYPDTARSKGEKGYFEWLLQCAVAVKWAWKQQDKVLPDRVSFHGTSQGGGGSLLLASLFANRGTYCVMADEPYLTNAAMADFRGAYHILRRAIKVMDEKEFWHYTGLCDTLSHVHRLNNFPVLLTVGTKDDVCPPETVKSLYDKLDTTKLMFEMKDRGHGYNAEFDRLMLAFANMYA